MPSQTKTTSPGPPADQTGESRPLKVSDWRRLVLFAAAVYLALVFFNTIVKALLLFFLAFLLAAVLNVPVRWLAGRGVPRGVSAAGVAVLVLGSLAAVGYFAGPPLVSQAATLITSAPQRIQRIDNRLQAATRNYPALQSVIVGDQSQPGSLLRRAGALLPRLGRYTLGLLGVIASAFFVLVAALYMLAAPRPLLAGLLAAVPPGSRPQAVQAMERLVRQLESWALATIFLMVIVGTACGLGLWAIGVSNALLFAIIAGFGEAIPIIGPILSAVPPMAVALADDPIKALWVALLFLVVQQVENNLLVPVIMGRTVKLHPVSILFFVLALGSLLGLLGSLLAVPTAIVVKVLFEEFYAKSYAPQPQALADSVTQIVQGDRPAH